jgi:hypothetical protein
LNVIVALLENLIAVLRLGALTAALKRVGLLKDTMAFDKVTDPPFTN